MSDPTIKGLPPPPVKYDGSNFRIAIVHARWNDAIIKALLEGTINKLKEQGVKEENIVVKSVPGSYELPFATKQLIEAGKVQSANAAPSMIASTTNLLSLIDNNTSSQPSEPKPSSTSTGPLTTPFDAVISIGCLIKGSTMHFEYICDSVTHGLMRIQLDTGTPVVFGVLTALNDDQALERAGIGRGEKGKGHNHGEDWGLAAVELAAQNKDWTKGVL
ncbi:6,7-dimethyl-8-ribityllumazine synthase [Kwoniella mangroviensis CBS 8886]|uniref:6,7-dimethyl-8-ribityllumazine synthase n=1 Tax=Kwoniella mangroviensis CBS 8507 TaxID=1296122 RepID=UPI00080D3100|nr:6,7-dimethyl-8-ribityllumazine synthase [Kwoniella mangroviensis CBS 8507]OCF69132.1 6,7-dimethyl-8-ribityllumazine synthase [Kwoniella mangroviensis CBS 8507]OCF72659.1 6,7-dimethyl-8-ribityllumazine synthase [Kwoniella mangroviensis CBS 8886]